MLSSRQMTRYERQILFPPIGEEGQSRLCASSVAIAGVGALGSCAADMLARAGVGRIHLIDCDRVELSNLQRQMLYTEADVQSGRPKAEAAAERLRIVNSDIAVDATVARIDDSNAAGLIAGADVVIDGLDNFAGRFAVCRAALAAGLPFVYGALSGTYALTMPVVPGETACIGCVYGSEPDVASSHTAATGGVIGPTVNLVTALQVANALKLLLGLRAEVTYGLTRLDVWDGEIETLPWKRRPDCPLCGAAGGVGQ